MVFNIILNDNYCIFIEVTMNMTVGMSVEMEMNVNMLDQLILLVQLSDVSVTSTNDYFYLM